jgi:biopolymer transport protein ExbD/biopolymer transport protein TolR
MLVLLIVFMITAPMLAAGMQVELPRASAAQPLEPKEPIVITVQKDGALFIGDQEVGRGQIAQAVSARAGEDRNRAIHLRGDREVAYGEMVAVMDQLAAGGFLKVALLANSRGQQAGSAPSPAAAEADNAAK